MLFALQSMAKRMSPVLSSYVAQPQQQSQNDVASEHGKRLGHVGLVSSPSRHHMSDSTCKTFGSCGRGVWLLSNGFM